MSKIKVIVKKEFADYLTSKKFLIVFGILLLLIICASFQGIQDYKSQMEAYQQSLATQEATQGRVLLRVPKPTLLSTFSPIIKYISLIGALLALMLSFDAISGERTKGTMKVLLSYPIYRDNVINGKFIAGFLAISMSVTLALSLASGIILGIGNLMPSGEETLRLVLLLAGSIIYMSLFFGIGLLFSILSKDSSNALLASIVVWLIGTTLIGSLAPAISGFIYPTKKVVFTTTAAPPEIGTALEKRMQLEHMIKAFSPSENYEAFANYMTMGFTGSPRYFGTEGTDIFKEPTLMESLSACLSNLIILLGGLIAIFVASYVLFMKQEIS